MTRIPLEERQGQVLRTLLHNFVAHPLAAALWLAGLPGLGDWLHDATKPGGSDDDEPRFRWHWQNLNERRDGTVGPPTNGRAWFKGTPIGDVGVEWVLWRKGGLLLSIQSPGYDDDLSVAVGLGPALFLSFDAPWARRLAQILGLNDKEIRLAIHDGAIWWAFQHPIHEWRRGTPWWRYFVLHLDDLVLGKQHFESKVIEERSVLVPMPERNYRGKAKVELKTWRRRWLPEERIGVSIEMDRGEQIPIPGKGESGYGCDEDALFGGSYPARTIDEAIGQVVASALRTRRRYGGENWRPAPKPVEVQA
jgi:hypothetical protein